MCVKVSLFDQCLSFLIFGFLHFLWIACKPFSSPLGLLQAALDLVQRTFDTFAFVPDEKVLKQLYHLEAVFFNEDLVFDHRNAVVLEGAQASDPEAECSSEQRNVFDHSFLVRRHNNASFRSCQRVVGREAIVMLEADLAETCKTEIAIVVSEVLVFPRLGPNNDLEKHRV